MEKRSLIAFLLAVLVIIYYPSYLKKFSPQKAQSATEITQLTESKAAPETVRPLTAPTPEAPVIIKMPDTPEEEVVINNSLMSVTFSSYDASIKKIVLLNYFDKKGKPLEIITPTAMQYRPFATTLPQSTSIYALSSDNNRVTCETTADDLKIIKTYEIGPDSYCIKAKFIMENVGEKDEIVPNYSVVIGTIFPGEESQSSTYLSATSLIDDKPVKTKFGKQGFRTSSVGKVFWSGIKSKYFTAILLAQNSASMATVTDYETGGLRGVSGQITMPQVTIPKGGKAEEEFMLYVGPKKYEILKLLGLRLDEIMDFGMLAPISKATLVLLNFFYKIVHNYGIAIILLTIMVYLVLYPLTLKSYKSMAEMQKIQPYIQELQKKYKDDPKRQQKEMMLLYKEHKINPLSGCFPMLLQMPVLIALFNTLRSAIELRGAPFIFWIKDLSEPDVIFKFPNGFAIHLLPIILVAAFYFQQKMTTAPAMTAEQAQQQKIMSNIMPLFMGFIFYSMPSGLNLYFGLSTTLGILSQYKLRKARTSPTLSK